MPAPKGINNYIHKPFMTGGTSSTAFHFLCITVVLRRPGDPVLAIHFILKDILAVAY